VKCYLSLAAAAVLATCAPVAAQEGAAARPTFMATGHASAGIRATRLRGKNALMLGGDVRLRVSRGLSVGAAGWGLIDPISISSAALGSDLALDVAYGGVVLQYAPRSGGTGRWAVRVLLGAGNGKISLPIISTEIAADNFGVIEPEVLGRVPVWSFLEVQAHLSYRLVFGVEDLPQVTADHLRGASMSLTLSLGPF
jgi:hypothetical protein